MISYLLILMALIAISLHVQAAQARVAILGDSITHHGRWLTKTRHTRPGVPAGLPLVEADTQAEKLMEEYRAACAR